MGVTRLRGAKRLEWKVKKWLEQGKICPECNKPLVEPYKLPHGIPPDDAPTIEHVISNKNPLRGKVPQVLQLLHYRCNQLRNERECYDHSLVHGRRVFSGLKYYKVNVE